MSAFDNDKIPDSARLSNRRRQTADATDLSTTSPVVVPVPLAAEAGPTTQGTDDVEHALEMMRGSSGLSVDHVNNLLGGLEPEDRAMALSDLIGPLVKMLPEMAKGQATLETQRLQNYLDAMNKLPLARRTNILEQTKLDTELNRLQRIGPDTLKIQEIESKVKVLKAEGNQEIAVSQGRISARATSLDEASTMIGLDARESVQARERRTALQEAQRVARKNARAASSRVFWDNVSYYGKIAAGITLLVVIVVIATVTIANR